MAERTYSFAELAAEAGLTERTLRSYIQRELIPRGSSKGRGARYGEDHLDRLRLIARIRAEGPRSTTLEQVRQIMDQLAPEAIRGLLDGSIPLVLVDDGSDEGRVVGLPTIDRPASSGVARSPAPIDAASAAPADEADDDHDEDEENHEVPDTSGIFPLLLQMAPRERPKVAVDGRRLLQRSSAGTILRRLIDRLRREDGVAHDDDAESRRPHVRVSERPPETWHRVRAGRDLEIHARGPLDDASLETLREAASELARLIYARASKPRPVDAPHRETRSRQRTHRSRGDAPPAT